MSSKFKMPISADNTLDEIRSVLPLTKYDRKRIIKTERFQKLFDNTIVTVLTGGWKRNISDENTLVQIRVGNDILSNYYTKRHALRPTNAVNMFFPGGESRSGYAKDSLSTGTLTDAKYARFLTIVRDNCVAAILLQEYDRGLRDYPDDPFLRIENYLWSLKKKPLDTAKETE